MASLARLHMITFAQATTGLWLILIIYWLVAAMLAKRNAGGTWWKGAIFCTALAFGIILLLRMSFRGQVGTHAPHAVTSVGIVTGSVGVGICALGIAIAIWARTHLGRNWGMPMSLRVRHELVTTGPYAYVRHPIYTGILLAFTGSTLVNWFPRILLLGVFLAYFAYAAKAEERSMIKQFPKEYPAYVKRTKMLVPFLL